MVMGVQFCFRASGVLVLEYCTGLHSEDGLLEYSRYYSALQQYWYTMLCNVGVIQYIVLVLEYDVQLYWSKILPRTLILQYSVPVFLFTRSAAVARTQSGEK
jgi:hypothetical protein